MAILGLIVEYNPFHNGHLYHLLQSKKLTKANLTIAVMSGPFVQRGEPALLDKWTRTRMALENGVDLIVELPAVYSTQSADWFAFGAISLLKELRVNHLVFGSESNSIQNLTQMATILYRETESFQETLRKNLSLGHSYPKALSLTFQQSQEGNNASYLYPNDILGLQYVLQIQRLNSSIHPNTLERKVAQYHDVSLNENTIASATSIRKSIMEDVSLSSISKYIPSTTLHHLQQAIEKRRLNSWENYYNTLRILLNNHSLEQLKTIHGMVEGLENRLKKSAVQSITYNEFISSVKTKRYTQAKIQRVLLHLLLNLTKERIDEMQVNNGPQYIRILGLNQKGRAYLNEIKHNVNIPLITNVVRSRPNMLDLDIQASQIYELGFHFPAYQLNEFKQKPIVVL
ncbi:nucleotidyltransferase [Tepidibacillus marianensis]|uniref:nucleotidyltransferase n=1 Tax=Tepidibacillus marianensis TaxID=3131995 RepID=UPI0030CE9AC1